MDIDRLEIPLTNGVAPEVPNPPAPPHVPLFPTINTSVHPRQIAPRQIASHPQMMSVADHLVALQWEKEMKAQIISHARAVFGVSYSPTATFDVVFCRELTSPSSPASPQPSAFVYRAHLIVYDSPSASNTWVHVLYTQRELGTGPVMSELMRMLRDRLGGTFRKGCAGLDIWARWWKSLC